ncbi:hypothetical protein RRG08_011848, partial [Elysia crispata]
VSTEAAAEVHESEGEGLSEQSQLGQAGGGGRVKLPGGLIDRADPSQCIIEALHLEQSCMYLHVTLLL